MNGIGRVVTWLSVALIAFTGFLLYALVFVEGFADVAAIVIPATLGPITTAIGILGGVWASRGVNQAVDEERQYKNSGEKGAP